MMLFIIISVVLILIDGLILYLGLLGKKMNFRILENDFLVNFGFSKRRIPFSSSLNLFYVYVKRFDIFISLDFNS